MLPFHHPPRRVLERHQQVVFSPGVIIFPPAGRFGAGVSRNSISAPSYGLAHTSATTTIPHHRYSVSSQNATNDAAPAQQARSASVVSTPRYEEVAHYRQELEEAKRENEMLKRRIRELERRIRGSGSDLDAQRGRRGGSTSGSAQSSAGDAAGTPVAP